MTTLLVVAHQPSANTHRLANALHNGATSVAVAVDCRLPTETLPEHVIAADGVIVSSTENFGAMAGLVKDFFERIYYPCLEHTEGKPCALVIRAGMDGSGTKAGIERILTGLRWRMVQSPLMLVGDFQPHFIEQTEQLAATVAAGLDAGIF